MTDISTLDPILIDECLTFVIERKSKHFIDPGAARLSQAKGYPT